MAALPTWSAVALAAAFALALGWLWTERRRFDRSQAATFYLKGFQYLLSGDPDGAIELLTRVASSGTLEAYFTLGALYRRKGELERALQLHRNILLSPGVEPRVRRQALVELGRDYRQGALWAQAAEALEAACREPGDGSPFPQAREELREVYVAAGRWAEAAECHALLAEARPDADGPLAPAAVRLGAHLWAEASRTSLLSGELRSAEAAAASALRACPQSGHAHFAEAAVRLARAEFEVARREALRVAELEPWASGIVFAWLGEVHPEGERAPLLDDLTRWLVARPENGYAQLLKAQLLRAEGRQGEAAGALRRLLEGAPAFLAARRELGQILLESGLAAELREQYQALLATLATDNALGRCTRCAQPARELHWRCPACGAWDWLELRAAAPTVAPA